MCFAQGILFAQNNPQKAKDGTFQLMQSTKVKQVLTTEHFEEIRLLVAKNRKDNSENTIQYSEHISIWIPSKAIVNNPSFVPFKELYK